MKRTYEMATPRLALGTAAVALSAVAMAVMVIVPATMEAEASEAPAMVAAVAAPGGDGTHDAAVDPNAHGACADAVDDRIEH